MKNNNPTGFGSTFTDHMFVMDWDEKQGWHNAHIEHYQPFSFSPASLHMHYGQEIFEGMKAFATNDNHIVLFRPQDHLSRFNRSAQIMCMPSIDITNVLHWIKKLIAVDRKWVPQERGKSLYIRPTMIATENTISLKPSSEYKFFVLLSPVGSLYENGFEPIKIMVSETYTRSSIGGVGMAKTGGNYAASMRAQVEAHKNGYAQVLWLDPTERKFVEEVGSMNIFFVLDNLLITPQLNNTILPGITRKSVLEIAKNLNISTSERAISIDEVVAAIKTGKLKECFGTGTASGITPIGVLAYKNHDYFINDNNTGPITKKVYTELMRIQQGDINKNNDWIDVII